MIFYQPVYLLFWIAIPILTIGSEKYDSDSFTNPRDRWVGLSTTVNTRDMGGYRTLNNYWVRCGILFRSDQLYQLTNEDMDKVKSLGIHSVIDLRNATESLTYPDVDFIKNAFRYRQFPIDIRPFSSVEEIYLDIITTYSSSIAGVFHEIAEPENLPLLYHCMWGKDRTGIVTALIHLLLHVPREQIIADYMLSETIGFTISPTWIEAVLNRVGEEGGIEAFLLTCGVDQKTQAAIRDNLLEAPSSTKDWELFN
jgi:protein tyrosine/serine phosphatase